MSPREAREIAAWLRQVHGDTAETFCVRMIKHFQNENGKVVAEWEIVLRMLQEKNLQDYKHMVARHTKGHDAKAAKFHYFPIERCQDG